MYNNWKNKKYAHTRSESERRDQVTSIRLTKEQRTKIQTNAKDADMAFSSYIVDAAVNGDKRLTPAMLVEFQNQINYACSVVEQTAPEKVVTMQEEMNKIWQKLM